jgi:hypothetical protein
VGAIASHAHVIIDRVNASTHRVEHLAASPRSARPFVVTRRVVVRQIQETPRTSSDPS